MQPARTSLTEHFAVHDLSRHPNYTGVRYCVLLRAAAERRIDPEAGAQSNRRLLTEPEPHPPPCSQESKADDYRQFEKDGTKAEGHP
jgi:hypothetical protein